MEALSELIKDRLDFHHRPLRVTQATRICKKKTFEFNGDAVRKTKYLATKVANNQTRVQFVWIAFGFGGLNIANSYLEKFAT